MLSTALLSSLFLLAPAGTVHVVDDGGGAGVDFVDLQSAIDAAAPGDTLLVKPGTYAGFVLGKALTITAETDQTVAVGEWTVTGIAAGQRVVLRGLATAPGSGQVILGANAGWIGLEDCVFAPSESLPAAGLVVMQCAAVLAVRCAASGDRAEGIASASSGLSLFDCEIDGGTSASDGLPALSLNGGTVFVEGGVLRGGDGAAGVSGVLSGCLQQPGDGGDGIAAFGLSPGVTLHAATLIGGTAGASASGCSTAQDGEPVDFLSVGQLSDLGGTAHVLDVETPVRAGRAATNVLAGEPGELAVLAIGFAPDATPFSPWSGVLATLNPPFVAVLGVVPASGTFTVEIPVPPPGTLDSVQLFEQAAFVQPSGVITLATPSFPLILSAAF